MHCLRADLGRDLLRPAVFLVALLALGSGFPTQAVLAQEGADTRQAIDRIVAVVGDEIVLKSEVDQLVQRQTRQTNVSFSSDLWMQALQQLVDRRLLAEKARQDTTITVSDQQLNAQLNQQIENLQRRAGGQEQLEQIYGKSVIEIKESFRDDMRGQILASKLERTRRNSISITPSEVRQWFERIPQDSLPRVPKTVRLSHIVRYPKPTQKARKEAQSLLTSIRDSIVSGDATIEEMARKYSDDTGTASTGGRLSNVALDQLVAEFAAVASQAPIGEISQVFYNESQQGYHIVRVNSRSGDTVDLNHILIRPEEPTGERAIEYLSTVRDTLLNNEIVTFELMAKRHSEDDRTAQNGGRVTDPQSGTRDLRLDALDATWKTTLRKLEPGEISKPTRVNLLNGDEAYHIVRLDRRVPAHRVNLETDYERIREIALQNKINRKMREWMDDLRDEIYVDIRVSESDLTAMYRR